MAYIYTMSNKPGTIASKWEHNELARRKAETTKVKPTTIKPRGEHRIPADLSIPEFLRRAA